MGVITYEDYLKQNKEELDREHEEWLAEQKRKQQERAERREREERVTSAFDDGYQFGDISKTIFKGGKKVAQNVVSSFKKSNAFDDGYQFGDISKTIAGTRFNVLKSAGKGFLRASESISDWGYNRLADLADLVGADEKAQEWRDFADQDTTTGIGQDLNHIIAKDYSGSKSDEEVNSYVKNKFQTLDDNSLLSEKGNQVAEEIARMTTIALYGQYVAGAPVTGATGKAAKATKALQNIGSSSAFYAGAASQAEIEARKAGADPETAHRYGIMSGSIEVLTENMFGGLGKVSNVLGVSRGYADKLTSKFTSKISGRILKNLIEFGIDTTGEGFEEWASGYLNAYAKKLTYMSDADIKQLLEDENLQDQFVDGMTLSLFMSFPNAAISTAQGRDLKTGFNATQENLEKQLINERVEEESKTGKVSNKKYAEIKEQVHENVAKGNVIGVEGLENAVKEGIVTPEEIEKSYTDKNVRTEIKKKVIGNNYVNNAIKNGNYDTIVKGISKDLNATNTLNKYQSEISKRLSNNPEYQQLFRQDPKKYGELVTQEAVKLYVADQIDTKAKEIDTEFERFDLSDKDTQQAKKFFKDIATKKNIRFVFEDNITTKDGKVADGYATTAADGSAEIHLNRNSSRNMVFTAKHELYHIIKGTELEKSILQYAMNKTGEADFEAAKKELLESYNKNEVNEEAAAKLAEKLFESKDFVDFLYNDSSANSKGLLKTVKDYFTKLVNNFTEEGRARNAQLKELENLKKMWVDNYNTQINNLGKKTRYEFSPEGMDKLIARTNPTTYKNIEKYADYTGKITTDWSKVDWEKNNIVIKRKLPEPLKNIVKGDYGAVIESHVLNNLSTKEQYNNLAEVNGMMAVKENDNSKNYHAVPLIDYITAIDSLDNPIAVYQYTSSDKNHNSSDLVFITNVKSPIKNNKDGSTIRNKNGQPIEGYMVVAYHITDKNNPNELPYVNGKRVKANIIKSAYSVEDALNKYENKAKRGEMVRVFQNDQQIKDNTDKSPYDKDGNLKVFDYDENTPLHKATHDTEGNVLSDNVRRVLNRVSPEMFDKKGNLFVANHMNKLPMPTLDYIDPVMAIGGPTYVEKLTQGKFKCSYHTDNETVAKGYALTDTREANSKKYTNISEVEDTLKNTYNWRLKEESNGREKGYTIQENNGKYGLYREPNDVVEIRNMFSYKENDFVAQMLNAKSFNEILDMFPNLALDAVGYKNKTEKAKGLRKINQIKKMIKNNPQLSMDIEDDFFYDRYNSINYKKSGLIKEYASEEELFRNFIHDVEENDPSVQDALLYKNYIYAENVFVVDAVKDGTPTILGSETDNEPIKGHWQNIYKVDDDVMESWWWNNVLLPSREIRQAELGPTGLYKLNPKFVNYLSTDELASYVALVVNEHRKAVGLPPYQAIRIDNIVDAGADDSTHTPMTEFITFDDPRIMKDIHNESPSNDMNRKYSMNSNKSMWQQYVDSVTKDIPSNEINFVYKEHLKNKPAPVVDKKSTPKDIKNNIANMTETIKTNNDLAIPTSKVMSPGEIANLTPESAKSTPNLPNYKVKTGEGDSKITKSIKKSNFLSQETKDRLVADAQINSYQTTTNKAEIDEAIRRIDSGGAKETLNWFNKEKKFDGTDVAQGLMYLKLYEEAGDFENATKVTRKLHDITRQYGQAIQAMSMLSRMTPEGMAYHAQTELDEMFNRMIDGKSKEWIQEHRKEFDLTPEEVQSIMDLTRQAANETDDYQKRVAIAKVQKIVSDKLPSNLSNKAKSYFRISMLFNPKTQVRNIVGNALIAPVNWVSDLFATAIDKKLAQKSGYRTVSTFSLKDYSKGFKKGAYESYNDFKQDINTRNTDLNRYEQLQGKSFSDKNLLGKSLNGIERVLNFAMDGGDRIFYEGEFTNALNNIMATNNVDTPTQDMIETAQNVALQRTWNDSNEYTKFVLNFRSSLNKAGGYIHLGNERFGIGDILLPFAKTPANLTKAIVDYSPLGFLQAMGKKKALLNNIENGTATMQQQRVFVDTMGKAFAGTLLYIAAYGLAASGAATGESDEDKDVKDFLQNTLGISSYSIKTPWGSFTYDWAQPIAAPLAIMTNAVSSVRNGDEKTGLKIIEAWLGSLNSASSVLMDQSFLQSFNDVMTNNDGLVTGMLQEISELPARGIPTFVSQINDMIDGTKRETYYKGHILQSGINYAKSKIPGVSQTLAPKRNTLGQEIKKYGGDNNIFNVFFNPANVNSQNMGKNAEEIYRIYEATGDKTVMPSVAPYSDTTSGHIYTPEERSKYQKITGDIINDTIDYLLNYYDDNTGYDYESLSDSEKAVVLSKINSFAKQVARKELLGTEISDSYKNAYEYYKHGDLGAYYIDTESANYALNYPEKYAVVTSTMTFKNYRKHSNAITELRANTSNDKEETIKYIKNIPASDFKGGYKDIPVEVKRAMLMKTYYSSYHDYDSQIVNAVLTHVNMKTKKGQKMAVAQLEKLGFKNVKIKGGYIYYD